MSLLNVCPIKNITVLVELLKMSQLEASKSTHRQAVLGVLSFLHKDVLKQLIIPIKVNRCRLSLSLAMGKHATWKSGRLCEVAWRVFGWDGRSEVQSWFSLNWEREAGQHQTAPSWIELGSYPRIPPHLTPNHRHRPGFPLHRMPPPQNWNPTEPVRTETVLIKRSLVGKFRMYERRVTWNK